MTTDQIKSIQSETGAKPDGVFGPLSQQACRGFLDHIRVRRNWPTRSEIASQSTIFGRHGTRDGSYSPPQKGIQLPFPIYYEGTRVQELHPHELVAEALQNVFRRLAQIYPSEGERKAAGIATYDGLYNPRPMRGSTSTWSMHAWAIAIDLNADENRLNQVWPQECTMPWEVVKAFTREGFWSLGGMENRDAMHFEATSGR